MATTSRFGCPLDNPDLMIASLPAVLGFVPEKSLVLVTAADGEMGAVLRIDLPDVGTGTLFAADMQQKAKGRWIEGALKSMVQSNRQAAQCLFDHGASACTDITGFGLVGHTVEMTKASGVDVEIDLDSLPVLDGAQETVGIGILSSLQPANVRLRRAIRNLNAAGKHERYPLIFDPQTSGGLLASLPAERAQSCLRALLDLGYAKAAIVGRVTAESGHLEPITLISRSN